MATLGVVLRPDAQRTGSFRILEHEDSPAFATPGYLCPKPENRHLASRNSETASGGSGLSKWKP